MKQTSLILSIVSIVAVIAMAIFTFTSPKNDSKGTVPATDSTVAKAGQGEIVYIQLDRVITEYDRYNDMRSAIEAKAQSIQNDITRRGQQFENEVTTFQDKMNKGLLLRSSAEKQQQELMQKEQELNTYVGQKQQELQEEEFVMNNTIMEDIKNFLARYNAEKGYRMILTTAEATNTIILGNESLDISDEVIAGLNEEYTDMKK